MRIIVGALLLVACTGAWGQQSGAPWPMMVFFDWGKPEMRSDDQAVLDQAASAWRASPAARIQLSGHTDRSGSAAFNLRASRKRAEMVKEELIKRGVTASAISVAAYGEERPLVPTEDGVREVQNRRVEIALTGTDGTAQAVAERVVPLINGSGQAIGDVGFQKASDGLALHVSVTGLAPGMHGIHLHAVGRCEGRDFKSAGGHWNPAGHQHGCDNPMGAHLGDLPNFDVTGQTVASLTLPVGGVTTGDLADADGTALVIHADPDDYKTDPSGNSGARIACAVLAPPITP